MTPPATSTPPRRHGFRISIPDALVLVLGAALTVWMHRTGHDLAWIVPAAVAHFFLFCNVFMVWRKYEFIWAALFILNVFIHGALGHPGWWPALAFQLPVTLAVILIQMRSPWYHGIFAARLNPRLREYLDGTLQTAR